MEGHGLMPVFTSGRSSVGHKRTSDDIRQSGGTLMYTMEELLLDRSNFPEGDHDEDDDDDDEDDDEEDSKKKRSKPSSRSVSDHQKLERRCL